MSAVWYDQLPWFASRAAKATPRLAGCASSTSLKTPSAVTFSTTENVAALPRGSTASSPPFSSTVKGAGRPDTRTGWSFTGVTSMSMTT